MTALEQHAIADDDRDHGALVALFEHLLADLRAAGPFIEALDWMDVEETLRDAMADAGH